MLSYDTYEVNLYCICKTSKTASQKGHFSHSTDQDSDQETGQGITSLKRLLAVPGNDVLPAAEIMKRLGLSHKPTFRKNYLNPALAQNLIERTIPDKPNSKNQKYRKIK